MAHNDLLPHMLMQLWNTTIPLFQQTVLKWQRNYMENSLKLLPTLLITMADNECQVLQHSNQWVETIDPSVVAMKAFLQNTTTGSTSILKTLAAHLTKLTKASVSGLPPDCHPSGPTSGQRHHQYDSLEWVYDPPGNGPAQ
jgi:isopenicillin N synthase-like dioxygenase